MHTPCKHNIRRAFFRRWARRWRTAARGFLLLLLCLLAGAALLRTLAALLEASALLVLALVAASVALPRGLGWYWRLARREAVRGLRQLMHALEDPPGHAERSAPSRHGA